MNAWLTILKGFVQSIVDAPAWVVLLLKITAILLAAWLVHLALMRANPRWRVFSWRMTAIGLIALPTVGWFLPALEIRVPPPPPGEEAACFVTASQAPLADRAMAGSAPLDFSSDLPEQSVPYLHPAEPNDWPETAASPSLPPPQDVSPVSDKSFPIPWTALLLVLWLGGTGILVFRLFIGHCRIWQLVRRAQQAPPWIHSECLRVARAIGCRCRVDVVQSPQILSPLLCGLRHPVLLLPTRMCEESYRGDLPGILAHELTHVRSHDLSWNAGLHWISIMLWFHPLAWRVPKVHLAACELVCDAVSVDFIGDLAAYCRTLARVAVEIVSTLPRGGIAMARSSAIGRRVSALRKKVFHLPLRRRSAMGFGLVAMLAVAVLGALQFAIAAATTAEPVAAADKTTAPPEDKETQSAKKEGESTTAADSKPKTSSLRVRVVEESGKPLAGTKLKVVYFGHKADYATDADGWATVIVPAPNEKTLALTAYPDGYPPAMKFWRNEAGNDLIPAAFTFTYAQGRTIGGLVRDEQGTPIPGVRVSLSIQLEKHELSDVGLDLRDSVFLTDADGRWHLDHVPQKIERIVVGLEHPDYIIDLGTTLDSDSDKRKIEDRTAVMVMKKGIPVSGTVTDPEGKPVANATVILGERHGHKRPSVSTDQKGQYRFASLAPGDTDLIVVYRGLAPGLRSLNVQSPMKPVDFRLEKGNTIRVRVVGKDGKPISGVSVSPEAWRGKQLFSDLEMRGKTDAEGRWSWTWAPKDAVETQFTLSSPDYRTAAVPLVPQAAEHVVTLYRVLTISGRVVDAETKQPIPSFHVIPGYRMKGSEDHIHWDRLYDTVEGKNGQYELKFTGPSSVHLARFEADGHRPAVSREFKDDEGRVTYDLALSKAENLNLLVRLPDGKPAAGADVCLCPEQPGKNYMVLSVKNGRFAYRDSSRPFMKVGADGRLSIEPQGNGFLLVVLHDQGFAQTTREELVANPQITLTAWARLEGVLRRGTRPVSGAKMVVSVPGTSDWRRWSFLNYRHDPVETDAEGKFIFTKLKPGKCSVWELPAKPAGAAGPVPHRKEIELVPGQTLSVRFGGVGRPVVGQIKWPAGHPPDGDISSISAGLLPKIPAPPSAPEATRKQGADALRAWLKQWMESEEGKAWSAKARPPAEWPKGVSVSRTGELHTEEGTPGQYQLNVYVVNKDETLPWEQPKILTYGCLISIPEIPGGVSDQPLDLGNLALNDNSPKKPLPVAVQPPAPQAPGEKTVGGLRDHLELLRYAAATCQENKAKIKTWQGRAKIESRSRSVYEKQTMGQDYLATAQFVFDRARKSVRWNTTLEKLTRIEQGQEHAQPVPQISNGMQNPEALYRLGSSGSPVNPANRPVTLTIFSSDDRSGGRIGLEYYDFNPLFYLDAPHGNMVQDLAGYRYDTADHPGASISVHLMGRPGDYFTIYPSVNTSSIKVIREGDHVTINRSMGLGMGRGDSTQRYALSLKQGCNPISYETIGSTSTIEHRWTWELCDGVWLPKTWKETIRQKDGRDEERKVTFVENRVNQEVEPAAFSFSRLGVQRGDNVQDRRTQEKYQYKGE